ncbi:MULTISPECIES: hypothetical protein [Novosphingobium]|nr:MULTISPECIES: hypothetical protein [unclassified Novosphingobium]
MTARRRNRASLCSTSALASPAATLGKMFKSLRRLMNWKIDPDAKGEL